MKHGQVKLAILGALLLLLGAWSTYRIAMVRHTLVVTAGGCHTPVTVIEPDETPAQGSVVVFHGLSANRRVMQYLGDDLAFDANLRVYLVDLPGHGDNTDPFSFGRAQQCAAATVESLIQGGEVNPKTTALLGHSLGGAIAIRLADREPMAATVAISPMPMITPQRMPSNLLVFSGQYDLRALKREAQSLQKDAGGERTDAEDFLQARAFHLDTVRHASHTSQLFSAQVEADARDWIVNSFEAVAGNDLGVYPWSSRSNWSQQEEASPTFRARLGNVWFAIERLGPLIGLLGLLLLFPAAVQIAGRCAGGAQEDANIAQPSRWLALLEGFVCALVGVLLLTLFLPLKFLHMYTGDYLASLLLIFGVLQLVLNLRDARASLPRKNVASFVIAAVLGMATILIVGAWLNWQLDDAWLNAPRWLRFAAILPVAWIFSFAEEVLLGPAQTGAKCAERFAVFLLLRLELWLACLFAAYYLASGEVLIILLILPLALFSILQRLATDAFRQRTGSAAAAALFAGILAAWLIAAVFPLT
ncbi:MAG: alpha/beta hydrolase [Candidatus Acidiferrales bacterium]